jgi:hypothetical protein
MSHLVPCPRCGHESKKVYFTWWGGFLGPWLFRHARCPVCGTTYHGRSGTSNETRIIIYLFMCALLALPIVIAVAVIKPRHVPERLEEWWKDAHWAMRRGLVWLPGPVSIGTSSTDDCVVGLAQIGDQRFIVGVSSMKNEDRFRLGPLKGPAQQGIQVTVDGDSTAAILTREHRFMVASCWSGTVTADIAQPKINLLPLRSSTPIPPRQGNTPSLIGCSTSGPGTITLLRRAPRYKRGSR